MRPIHEIAEDVHALEDELGQAKTDPPPPALRVVR